MALAKYFLSWLLSAYLCVVQGQNEEELCSSFGTVKTFLQNSNEPLKEYNVSDGNYNLSLHFLPDELLYMGEKSLPTSAYGQLVHIFTIDEDGNPNPKACDDTLHGNATRIPDGEDWIALIERGTCVFDKKIQNAVKAGAGAVLVYNSGGSQLQPMAHGNFDAVTIMLSGESGWSLRVLADFTEVYVNVSYDRTRCNDGDQPSNLSVMIVAISFVAMMMISLTWLVFYYILRHRNLMKATRKNEKLERAMKKVLKKIGETTLSSGNISSSVDQADCTYCLDGFVVGETLRTLPCRHKFHKKCVDPWLIKNRTCPNCKENILLALGVKVKGIPDLSAAENATDNPELQQLNPDGTVVPPQSDEYYAGSQLLTDGQNMFLYVPNNSNDRLYPHDEVHLEIAMDDPLDSEQH